MYIYSNPHPAQKRVADCVKRACCIASGINYHDIAIMLNRYRKVTGCSKFNSKDNWKSFVENVLLGYKNYTDMRYINDGRRYTVAEFDLRGTHIVSCAKHIVTVINGDYYDTWDSGEKSIYIDYKVPDYERIVKNIKEKYPELCKGLGLERRG